MCVGDGRWLFALVVLLVAGFAALFANGVASLILTPIVIAMLRALGYDEKATLAFVMAAGFIADTSSLPLVVSNLVNIVSADFFHIRSEEHTSELQSLMRNSYAVFCLKKTKINIR